MRRTLPTLLAGFALATGLSACGSGSPVNDAQPKSTPDLVAPATVDLGGSGASTTGTTGTTSTTSTTGTTGATSTGTAAPTTTSTAAPAAPTGGTTTPAATPTTGGQSGGFSDFCSQNPGAC